MTTNASVTAARIPLTEFQQLGPRVNDGRQEQRLVITQRDVTALRQRDRQPDAGPRRSGATGVTGASQLTTASVTATWNAWRVGFFETLAGVGELLVDQRVQAVVGAGAQDERDTPLFGELQGQLQGTMALWGTYGLQLHRQGSALAATCNAQALQVERCGQDMHAQAAGLVAYHPGSRSAARVEVAVAAARSYGDTLSEVRTRVKHHADEDVRLHQELFVAAQGAVVNHLHRFERELANLQAEAAGSLRTLHESAQRKQGHWHAMCVALQALYEKDVHRPVTEQLQALRQQLQAAEDPASDDPSALALTLAQAGMDNTNDPHCIRRCETAMTELEAMMRFLQQRLPTVERRAPAAGAGDDDAALDDPDMQAARRAWARDSQAAGAERESRLRALAVEERRLADALANAKRHMQGLHQQVRDAQTSEPSLPSALPLATDPIGTNRRLAAVARAAQLRHDGLRTAIRETETTIAALHDSLKALQAQYGPQDRLHHCQALLYTLHEVHSTCQRMRGHFTSAVQQEESLCRLLTEQLAEDTRRVGGHVAAVVRRTIDAARSRMREVGVELQALQDRTREAERRGAVLAETATPAYGLDGPEVRALTSVQEYRHMLEAAHAQRVAVLHTSSAHRRCNAAEGVLRRMLITLGRERQPWAASAGGAVAGGDRAA